MKKEKGPAAAATTIDCSFDCNICLQLAKDPVVTLCGHLYCWPCMYNLLQSGSCHCSACNTPISHTSLIPLYGQDGHSVKEVSEIPCRPSAHALTALEKPNIQHPESFRRTSSPPQPTTMDLLGGTVMTTIMSPRLLGSARDMYSSSNETVQRQEDFLQQLWAFLFLCALMCLLVF